VVERKRPPLELSSIDYPGLQRTSLEQRWSAAITTVEQVFVHLGIEKVEMPKDDNQADAVLDELTLLMDALGLEFVSRLEEAEIDVAVG